MNALAMTLGRILVTWLYPEVRATRRQYPMPSRYINASITERLMSMLVLKEARNEFRRRQGEEEKLLAETAALTALAERNRSEAFNILYSDDWMLLDHQDGDEFFSRRHKHRTVWKFTCVVACNSDLYAKQWIQNCDQCPSWNPSVKQCHTVRRIKEGLSVTRQITNSFCGGLVSPREFVNLNLRGRDGTAHYSAVVSLHDSSVTPDPSCVRAENFPTVFVVRPCVQQPESRCIVEGILHYDAKLALIPNQVIERSMNQVWRGLRRQTKLLATAIRDNT